MGDMSTVATSWSIIGLIRLDSGMPDAAMEACGRALEVIDEYALARMNNEDFDNLRDALEAEGLEPPLPACWADGDRDTG
jgi:hypothetical protein